MKSLNRLGGVACAVFFLAAESATPAFAQKADAVRPEVGKPLQDAQNLLRSGKHREAMAKVKQADAVSGKSAGESLLIQRMRGSVASAAGDMEAANKAFEAVLNSGKVSGRDALQMEQAIAVNHYKAKEYAAAAQWTQRYFKEGGSDPAMRTVLLQSYYLGNDCASVNKMLGSASEERKSSEEELQILAEVQKTRAKDEQDAAAAADGNDLVKLGLEYVYEGQGEKGFGMVEKGIKKGGLRRPEDAKLSLGEAQLTNGQKARGVQTLKTVSGADGAADIARLWVLYARG